MASDTRNRIVTTAARLFHGHGYHATSVAAILSEAEVNSGSLYHFFDSKEALLAGVVEYHLQRLGPTIFDPAEAAHHDPVERLFVVLEHYRRTLLGSGFTRGCAVGRLAFEIGGREPEARALVESYFTAWTDRVERWLAAAGDRLPSSTDRAALAQHVLAVTQGGIMLALAAAAIDPFDAAVAELRAHIDLLMRPSDVAVTEAPPANTERRRAPAEELTPDTPGWRSW